MRIQRWIAVLAIATFAVAACGDSDSDSSDDVGSETESTSAPASNDDGGAETGDEAEPDATQAPAAAPQGAGGGTMQLGDETVSFDSARCFLQEQDAAAGGGKILFVVQAFGTLASGEEVAIDISRYDEDSQFTGDDIIIDVGDPFSAEAWSLSVIAPLGTVSIDGRTVSAGGLTFTNFDDFSETSGSFEINC